MTSSTLLYIFIYRITDRIDSEQLTGSQKTPAKKMMMAIYNDLFAPNGDSEASYGAISESGQLINASSSPCLASNRIKVGICAPALDRSLADSYNISRIDTSAAATTP